MSEQNDQFQNKRVITQEDSFDESHHTTQQLQNRLPTGPQFTIESRDNEYAQQTIQKTKSGDFSSKQQPSDDIKNELMNINFNEMEERRALEQYIHQHNDEHKMQRTPIGINLNLNWNSLSNTQKHIIISDRQLKIMEDPSPTRNAIMKSENTVEGLNYSQERSSSKQHFVRNSLQSQKNGKSPLKQHDQSSKQYISVYSQKFLKNQQQSTCNSRENSQPGLLQNQQQQSFQQIKTQNLKLAVDVFNDKQQIVLSSQSRQRSTNSGNGLKSQRGPQLSNRNQTMNRVLSTINKGCTPQQQNQVSSVASKLGGGGSRPLLPQIKSPSSSSQGKTNSKNTKDDLEEEKRDYVDFNFNTTEKEQTMQKLLQASAEVVLAQTTTNKQNQLLSLQPIAQNGGNVSVSNLVCNRDTNTTPKQEQFEDNADGLLEPSAAHLSSVEGSNAQSRQKLEKVNLRVVTSSDITKREQPIQQQSEAILIEQSNHYPENLQDYFLPQSNLPLRKYLLKNYQALSEYRKHFRQYEDQVEDGLLTYSINPQERISWKSSSQERNQQAKVIQRKEAKSENRTNSPPVLGQQGVPMAAKVAGNQNLQILDDGSHSFSQDPKDESVILNIQFQSEQQKEGLMRKNIGYNAGEDLLKEDLGVQKKDSLQEVSVSQINSPMDIVQNMQAKIKGKSPSVISSYGATNLFNSKSQSLGPFQHKSTSSGMSFKRQSRQSKQIAPMLVQGYEISAPAQKDYQSNYTSTQKLRIQPKQCDSPEVTTNADRGMKRSRHSIEVPNVTAQIKVVGLDQGTQANLPSVRPEQVKVSEFKQNSTTQIVANQDKYLIPQKQLKKRTAGVIQTQNTDKRSYKKELLTKEEIFEISSSMFMGVPLSKNFHGARSKNNLSSQQYMSKIIPAINQSQQLIRPPTVPEQMKRVKIHLDSFSGSKSNPPKSRQQKRVHMSTQKIGSPNSKNVTGSVINTTLSHRGIDTQGAQSVEDYLKMAKARQKIQGQPLITPDISVLMDKNIHESYQKMPAPTSQAHWSKQQQQKYLEQTRKKSYSQAKKGMLRFFKGQRNGNNSLKKRSNQQPSQFQSQNSLCLDSFAMSQGTRVVPSTQQQARRSKFDNNQVQLENLTKSRKSSEHFDHETELGPEYQQIPHTSGRANKVEQPKIMLGDKDNQQYQSQQFMILQDDGDRKSKEGVPGRSSISGKNQDILSSQEYKSEAFSLANRPKTQQSRQTFAITQKVMTFCNDYSERLLGSAANLSISQEQSKDTKNLDHQDEEFFYKRSKFNSRFVRKMNQKSPVKGQEVLPTIQGRMENKSNKGISGAVLSNQVMLDDPSVFDSQLNRLSQASRQSIQDTKQTLLRVNPKNLEDNGNIRVSQLSKAPSSFLGAPHPSTSRAPFLPQRLVIVKAEDGVSNSFHMSISKNNSPMNQNIGGKHDDYLLDQDQLNRGINGPRRNSHQNKPAKEEQNIQILDKFQCVEPNQTQVARANTFSRAQKGRDLSTEILAGEPAALKDQGEETTSKAEGAMDRLNSYTDQSMDYQVKQCGSNQKPLGRERDPQKKSFHINSQLTGSSLYTGHKAARLSHDQGQPYFTPNRRSPHNLSKLHRQITNSQDQEPFSKRGTGTQRKETDKTEKADLSGVHNTSRNEDLTMIDLNYTGFGPQEQQKSTVRKQTHENTPKGNIERSIIPLTPDPVLPTSVVQTPSAVENQEKEEIVEINPFAGLNLIPSPDKRSNDANYFSDETQSMLEAKMSSNEQKQQYALNNISSSANQRTNNYRSTLQLRDQSNFVDSESMARMSMIEGLQSCSGVGENRLYNPTKFSRRNHLFELTQRSKDDYVQLDYKQRNKTQDLITLQQTQYINSRNKSYKHQINMISNQVARQTHRVINKQLQKNRENQNQSILGSSVNPSLQGQNPIRHALRSEQILQMKAKRSNAKKQEPVYNKIIKSIKEFKNTHNKLKGDAALNEKMKYVVEIQYGSCLSNSRLSYRPQTDVKHSSMMIVKRENAIVTDSDQQRVQTQM